MIQDAFSDTDSLSISSSPHDVKSVDLISSSELDAPNAFPLPLEPLARDRPLPLKGLDGSTELLPNAPKFTFDTAFPSVVWARLG
jgi:hypothetical protein